MRCAPTSRWSDSLKRARSALKIDGDVVDCDAAMPAALFTHAWRVIQERKATKLAGTIDRLAVKLSEILRSDFARSDAGRSADSLKAAIGDAHGGIFDFAAMSRLLDQGRAEGGDARQSGGSGSNGCCRCCESQAFVADAGRAGKRTPAYSRSRSTAAPPRWRRTASGMPKVTELAKALAVAELEIKGEYKDASHDAYFADYGSDGLDPEELALFPDYLVCVNAAALDAVESATLLELLSAGLPVKVMVQTDDILEESQLGDGHFELRHARAASLPTWRSACTKCSCCSRRRRTWCRCASASNAASPTPGRRCSASFPARPGPPPTCRLT